MKPNFKNDYTNDIRLEKWRDKEWKKKIIHDPYNGSSGFITPFYNYDDDIGRAVVKLRLYWDKRRREEKKLYTRLVIKKYPLEYLHYCFLDDVGDIPRPTTDPILSEWWPFLESKIKEIKKEHSYARRKAKFLFAGESFLDIQLTDINYTVDSRLSSIRRTNRRIFDIVYHTNFKFFVTFTFNGDIVNRFSSEDTFGALQKWLKKTKMLYRRNGLDMFKYLIIPEFHKDGALHFHCLFTEDADNLVFTNSFGYLDISNWNYGFSNVAEIYIKDSKINIAAYITKYITKGMIKVLPRNYFSNVPKFEKEISIISGEELIQNYISDVVYISDSEDYKKISLRYFEKL